MCSLLDEIWGDYYLLSVNGYASFCRNPQLPKHNFGIRDVPELHSYDKKHFYEHRVRALAKPIIETYLLKMKDLDIRIENSLNNEEKLKLAVEFVKLKNSIVVFKDKEEIALWDYENT